MAVPCAGDTCTVIHSIDPITGALLADAQIAVGFDIGGSLNMPIGPSTNADYNTPSNTTIIREHDVTFSNQFNCDAVCDYSINDLKLIGNRRSGHTDSEAFYMQGLFSMVIAGESHIFAQNSKRVDIFGSWSGGAAINGETPATLMQHSYDLRAVFRVPALGAITITNRFTLFGKYHFDMSADGVDGGVNFHNPVAIMWPEAAF